MSRIGQAPIPVPAGVDVTIAPAQPGSQQGQTVTVKGPKGTLTREIASTISLTNDDGVLNVARPNDERENRALHGLTRSLVNNMVVGVTDGFRKNLEIVGVEARARAGVARGPLG